MQDLIKNIEKQVPDFNKLSNKEEVILNVETDLENKSIQAVIEDVKKIVELNRPRLLTKAEINKMLSRFNEPNILLPKVKEVYVDALKRKLKRILKRIKLASAILEQYEDEMYMFYSSSIADAGLAVGAASTESITQHITQLTLSSFHTSGTAKVSPLDRIEQIINTTKNDSKKLNHIFFNAELFSRNDIEEKKRNIQSLRLRIFVTNYEIESVNEIMSRNDYWYSIYDTLFNGPDIKSTYILRLYFDKSTMDFYQVSLEDISIALNTSDFSTEETNNYIKTIISPKNDMIIDIYLNDENIFQTKTKKLSVDQVIDYSIRTKVFIDQILIPSLDGIIIKGIPGVKSFEVANELMSLFFLNEIKQSGSDWKVYLNYKSVLQFNMTQKKMDHFLNLVGIKLKTYTEKKIIVTCDSSPISIINKKIGEANNNLESDIYNYNSIFYGISEGGDLKDIFMREDINSYATYSDNIHEINKILGIEAARSFLNIEVAKTIGASPGDFPVSSRHISITTDWMTNLGELVSMTVSKIKKFDEGYNNLATIGKPVDFYRNAGAVGSYETSNTVANAICLGSCIPVGTGLPKVMTLEAILRQDSDTAAVNKKKYIADDNMPVPIINNIPTTIIKNIDNNTKIPDDTGIMSLNLKSDILNETLDLLENETRNIDTVQKLENFEKVCAAEEPKSKRPVKSARPKKAVPRMIEFED